MNALKSDIERYLMEAPAPLSTDPVIWWRDNQTRFQKVSCSARRYLGSPPSSVESERLFSIGGNIYSPKRNRLTAENGETLMFLNFNLRALNFNC